MARNEEIIPEGGEPEEMADQPVKRVWGANPDGDSVVDEAGGQKKKRERLTGADVEARWAEGAGERSALVRRATSPRSLRAIATGALVLVALGGMLAGSMSSSAFEQRSSANQQQIEDLEAKIASLSAKVETQPDKTKMAGYVQDAHAVGGQVASIQNGYLGLGITPEATEKRKQLADQLGGLLAKGGAQNGRVPWASVPKNTSGDAAFGWKFVSATASVEGEADEVNLLWTFNNSKTGDLINWATGVYSGSGKKITKVSWGQTKQGASMIPPTDSGNLPEDPNLDDHDHGESVPPPTTSSPSASPSASVGPSASPSAGSTGLPTWTQTPGAVPPPTRESASPTTSASR